MKDIYVVFKSGDIKGESRDATHKSDKAVEVSSFEHFIRQPKSSSSSSAGGHTAERTEHGEMVFTKDIDAASTKLWQACSAGTVYKDIEVFFYRALGGSNTTQSGNKRINYLKVALKNVVISSVTTNISSGSELPTETFGLRYSAVQWTYNEAPIDGTTASNTNVQGMWNLKDNTVSFAA
ncbi:MAG: type VI secretion system tube protein Hcp [Rubrivivax sp.]|nr:type VI secretion system tube protein Hcp [Rubrivivax sp.]